MILLINGITYAVVFSCPASSDANNYFATEPEGAGNETASMNTCICVCVYVCVCAVGMVDQLSYHIRFLRKDVVL